MQSRKTKAANIALTIIAILLGLCFLFPIYWLVRSSLMSLKDLYQKPPIIMPLRLTLENYIEVLSQNDILIQFGNSLRITILSVIGTLISSSLTAYSFSRFNFKLKNFWFVLIISTMMLPSSVTLIPQYQMWNKMQLLGTTIPLIIPAWFGGGAYFIFMLRQFFSTIPKELDEAATVDGAGHFRIFWQILLPLMKPALIVVGLFSFINYWNEFFYTMIYLNGHEKLITLTLGLYLFKGVYQTNYGAVLAFSAVISLPALIFFTIGNRYFVEGISLTGIKG